MTNFIIPNWPAPKHVKACTTTRIGGYSKAPFDSLNLADHVGDHYEDVERNRRLLREELNLSSEPNWLKQVHSTKIISLDTKPNSLEADGSFSRKTNVVCAVLTADCLPILITNEKGTIVSAIHAGWKGIANGIIEHGVRICSEEKNKLLAWLGPAISQNAFEVGTEVYERFVKNNAKAETAFKPSVRKSRWMADIYALAKIRLQSCGVDQIYGGNFCTYNDERFYSYRRSSQTGRMATLIWIG